jgi:uncharacterized protein (TIGR03083 family)
VTSDVISTFLSAAESFAGLVRELPAPRWDGPGLGEWDLRALVGHASRSLVTVSTYLQSAGEREDIASPQEYYVFARTFAAEAGTAAVVERGRQAGADLGDDPAAAIDALVDRVRADLDDAEDRIITVIGGVGIRLFSYLPTRTFELAVHGFDIARAAGVDYAPPAEVLDEAATLAARIAVALGRGGTVLLSLTGRTALPESFSVV